MESIEYTEFENKIDTDYTFICLFFNYICNLIYSVYIKECMLWT